MSDRPLSVAVCDVLHNNKILLNKRIHGAYVGMWALPGGKIEINEHVSSAAIRELEEECGIKSKFKNYLGSVSELLIENGSVRSNFLLHLCELEPETDDIEIKNAGDYAWFDLNDIENLKDKMIPSDFLMIKKMILNKEKNYYNCIIEKIGNEHKLRTFE